MVKGGPIASLTQFNVVKTEVLYHVLLGRPWLHKHRLVPSSYHQCVKGRLNGRMIRIVTNSSPFEQTETHLVETMFYDQWAPSGESSVSKPWGTFVPRWEDVWSDPKTDLRELLSQKKKMKEAPTVELDDTPQCVRVRGLDGKIVYKLWTSAGPISEIQAGPRQKRQHKSLVCCVAQESLEEGSNEEKDEEVIAKKDVYVMAE